MWLVSRFEGWGREEVESGRCWVKLVVGSIGLVKWEVEGDEVVERKKRRKSAKRFRLREGIGKVVDKVLRSFVEVAEDLEVQHNPCCDDEPKDLR